MNTIYDIIGLAFITFIGISVGIGFIYILILLK